MSGASATPRPSGRVAGHALQAPSRARRDQTPAAVDRKRRDLSQEPARRSGLRSEDVDLVATPEPVPLAPMRRRLVQHSYAPWTLKPVPIGDCYHLRSRGPGGEGQAPEPAERGSRAASAGAARSESRYRHTEAAAFDALHLTRCVRPGQRGTFLDPEGCRVLLRHLRPPALAQPGGQGGRNLRRPPRDLAGRCPGEAAPVRATRVGTKTPSTNVEPCPARP